MAVPRDYPTKQTSLIRIGDVGRVSEPAVLALSAGLLETGNQAPCCGTDPPCAVAFTDRDLLAGCMDVIHLDV